MKYRITYILSVMALLSGCAGSLDFDADRFYASTAYALPESDEITFRGIESSQQITVSSNCTWTFSTDSEWLSVNIVENSGALNITAYENPTDDPRVGIIRLYNETQITSSVKVTQLAAERPLVTDGSESANCYIVSRRGIYKFPALKGNSSLHVSAVKSVEVLWESFGTSEKPAVGDLISKVSYFDGEIVFSTQSEFNEGNALIAAKDADGNILWSWHIWLTDQPQGQVYYNNAGTMMDRNLGATSATPGDICTHGLLYQWGRKDPFLSGSSAEYGSDIAEASVEWPTPVMSAPYEGTIEYAIAHPMTFIGRSGINNDWLYYDDDFTDTRWTTSELDKSIYDPCPSGWRVPDGGSNGIWAKAMGSGGSYRYTGDVSVNKGINFSKILGNDTTIWYPLAGIRIGYSGEYAWNMADLFLPGSYGHCWSASTSTEYLDWAISLDIYKSEVDPTEDAFKCHGYSIRCVKE